MVRRRERQRSLWEVVLQDADKLWPADLRRIDALLDQADVLDPIVAALEARWRHSRRRGRPGTPAEVVLRMLLLRHPTTRWSTMCAPIIARAVGLGVIASNLLSIAAHADRRARTEGSREAFSVPRRS